MPGPGGGSHVSTPVEGASVLNTRTSLRGRIVGSDRIEDLAATFELVDQCRIPGEPLANSDPYGLFASQKLEHEDRLAAVGPFDAHRAHLAPRIPLPTAVGLLDGEAVIVDPHLGDGTVPTTNGDSQSDTK